MSRVTYVNGTYTNYSNSVVHIEDRGYQFGDGVYEVFAVINKQIVDYDAHLKRLFRSLKELKIKSPINKKAYYFHIRNIINKNLIIDGIIYLQITRGVAPRDFKFPTNIKPSLVIIGRPFTRNSYGSKFNEGIKVKIVDDLPVLWFLNLALFLAASSALAASSYFGGSGNG